MNDTYSYSKIKGDFFPLKDGHCIAFFKTKNIKVFAAEWLYLPAIKYLDLVLPFSVLLENCLLIS